MSQAATATQGIAGTKATAGDPEVYTREEFAAKLGVAVRTVDEWIAKREVGFFRLGRNVRISRAAAAEFVLSHTVLARQGLPRGLNREEAAVLRELLEPLVRELVQELSATDETRIEHGRKAA